MKRLRQSSPPKKCLLYSARAIIAASNYAGYLARLERYAEAKLLLRKSIPVARRTLGDCHDLTLSIRINSARALHEDPGATLDDLSEAVTTLEELKRIAQRVLGSSHPTTVRLTEEFLRDARAALRARETPS